MTVSHHILFGDVHEFLIKAHGSWLHLRCCKLHVPRMRRCPWLPGFHGIFLRYLLPVIAVLAAAFAFRVKIWEIINSVATNVEVVIDRLVILIIFLLMCCLGGALAYAAWSVGSGAILVWKGLPVDNAGTIIPISHSTVIGLFVSVALISICLVRHVFTTECKIFKNHNAFIKLVYSVAFTAAVATCVSIVFSLYIYCGYVNKKELDRAFYIEQIEYFQNKLNSLDDSNQTK